jgi:hypothetical protein
MTGNMITTKIWLRVYLEEGLMPKALEAPFSLVPTMEAVSLLNVMDLSRCRKVVDIS